MHFFWFTLLILTVVVSSSPSGGLSSSLPTSSVEPSLSSPSTSSSLSSSPDLDASLLSSYSLSRQAEARNTTSEPTAIDYSTEINNLVLSPDDLAVYVLDTSSRVYVTPTVMYVTVMSPSFQVAIYGSVNSVPTPDNHQFSSTYSSPLPDKPSTIYQELLFQVPTGITDSDSPEPLVYVAFDNLHRNQTVTLSTVSFTLWPDVPATLPTSTTLTLPKSWTSTEYVPSSWIFFTVFVDDDHNAMLLVSLTATDGDANVYFGVTNFPTSFQYSQTAQIEKVVDGVEYQYLFSSVDANTQYYVAVENLDQQDITIEMNFVDLSDVKEDRGSCGPSATASTFMIVLSVILIVISVVAFAITFRWRLLRSSNSPTDIQYHLHQDEDEDL